MCNLRVHQRIKFNIDYSSRNSLWLRRIRQQRRQEGRKTSDSLFITLLNVKLFNVILFFVLAIMWTRRTEESPFNALGFFSALLSKPDLRLNIPYDETHVDKRFTQERNNHEPGLNLDPTDLGCRFGDLNPSATVIQCITTVCFV